MTLKKYNDEVDILELVLIIWNKKLIIFSIVFTTLVSVYVFEARKDPTKTLVISEIKPITVYDETKYQIYNSFINSIKADYISVQSNKNFFEEKKQKESFNQDVQNRIYELKDLNVQKLLINSIDKNFLFQLFTDKINQRSFLINVIKKFNFFKKEDFANNLKYEEAVDRLASKIKLFKNEDKNLSSELNKLIQFRTLDVEKWQNFLKFLEKETNSAIQVSLADMFADYISYSKKIKKYAIEDIENRLTINNLADFETKFLEKQRSILVTNRYDERLEEVFVNSPMANKLDFKAASISYDASRYEINDSSIYQVLVMVGLISAIIAIFIVLIANAIKNRT